MFTVWYCFWLSITWFDRFGLVLFVCLFIIIKVRERLMRSIDYYLCLIFLRWDWYSCCLLLASVFLLLLLVAIIIIVVVVVVFVIITICCFVAVASFVGWCCRWLVIGFDFGINILFFLTGLSLGRFCFFFDFLRQVRVHFGFHVVREEPKLWKKRYKNT